MSVFISSNSNIQEDDLLLAKKITSGMVDVSKERMVLEDLLSKIFKDSPFFLFNRGRDALYIALRALGVSSKDEVIIQAFTCIAVPAPILWLGATPRYVDIDPKSFNVDIDKLRTSINEFTRVIILQHTFGNLLDVKSVREIVEEVNNDRKEKEKIYIIEDCAHHSLLSNREVLRYSDIGLFSFAQDKSISSTQGGLVVVKNPNFSKIFSILYDAVPEQNEKDAKYNAEYIVRWAEIKNEYFKSIFNFYPRLTIGKLKILLYRFLGKIKKQASQDLGNQKDIKRYSNHQASLLLNQIPKIRKYDEHREKITSIYDEVLKEDFVFQKHSKCLLRYPVLLSNPAEVLAALSKEKIIGGRWYSSVVFPLSENFERVGYIKASCMKAELCAKYVINLPTGIEVSEEVAKDISRIVNRTGISIKI
ncbi:MAG: DegT/DnrJ/EryC1/StrS aminotransferase [candidate division WS6 bacterium GW2011_GWE1_34_7]|uniref:DegT/DnrJ/EryC1/StrS aminotransferase n=1 Tax=candidate division WS6 bacterium GW2011_GWE1_34_7 TaxID=1619093 RepID=A0A0G0B2A4_9BACT|nr:MAG: DegT/DnrJ/EryC1/StrS aminotransferase [candidate division WS6 bacterium GW2011_GWE1_34_7]